MNILIQEKHRIQSLGIEAGRANQNEHSGPVTRTAGKRVSREFGECCGGKWRKAVYFQRNPQKGFSLLMDLSFQHHICGPYSQFF